MRYFFAKNRSHPLYGLLHAPHMSEGAVPHPAKGPRGTTPGIRKGCLTGTRTGNRADFPPGFFCFFPTLSDKF
ncbi:MAG: hypothetical protein CW342_09350 [Thermoactinomycetaceae bacterium]|nr:hypothetical protein [Bacillota bacterium]MBO2533078.1 hypothetical protein [Thermoactinomycetaceae bacterium]